MITVLRRLIVCCVFAPGLLTASLLGEAVADEKPAVFLSIDEQLSLYFEQQTSRIEAANAAAFADVGQWAENQELYRGQLAEMLGLSPLPERTPLETTITGEIDEDEFVVKKLHYQALPGLYVTANLYVPKQIEKPCPAVLYVCGHSRNVKDGVSFGNKTGYHHHGVWFARNGYVCLTIDTIQLGEFQGVHHGTYRKGMWWWNARGYTPAGVEAWNGMRAVDLLQSLPEVDGERIGITGRSGGGAYSWYTAAMDTRIQVVVPVAGITSMRNHVVDGCIEGHCDCMFMVNTYGWDFPQLAALIAPRPLLITNTDKDRIFPLDGVMDVFWKTRTIYEGMDAGANLGIAISEGPHKDTQRLQVNAFEWFNRFLKGDDSQAEPSEKLYEPEQLRVFTELPADERTSHIENTFLLPAQPQVPQSAEEWSSMQSMWKQRLLEKSFAAWPSDEDVPLAIPYDYNGSPGRTNVVVTYQFSPQSPWMLDFIVRYSDKKPVKKLRIELVAERKPISVAEAGTDTLVFAPRGLGQNNWSGDERERTHIRRRFALLGQTIDGMRLWDVCQLVRAVRKMSGYDNVEITLAAEGDLAGIAVYAPLFVRGIDQLELTDLPVSHEKGPTFLNVLRSLDIPEALAMTAAICPIELKQTDPDVVEYAEQVRRLSDVKLNAITIRPAASDDTGEGE